MLSVQKEKKKCTKRSGKHAHQNTSARSGLFSLIFFAALVKWCKLMKLRQLNFLWNVIAVSKLNLTQYYVYISFFFSLKMLFISYMLFIVITVISHIFFLKKSIDKKPHNNTSSASGPHSPPRLSDRR